MPPHVVQVHDGEEAFADLFAVAAEAGIRIGWLTYEPKDELPGALDRAAESGAFRAVAVSPGVTVAVKRRQGPAVLRDLLREYFTGCALVLIRGAVEAPVLSSADGEWRLQLAEDRARTYSGEAFISALRSPNFLKM